MKKDLVIDDDIVKNKTLYKKVNDIKKERENEKEKDLISRRKNNIISFFMILIIIGGINFFSSISRFDNARMLEKGVKQISILVISLFIFYMTSRTKIGDIIYKIVSKPAFRIFILVSSLIIFCVIAYTPSESLFPTINGGKGWVHIGPMSIQVPEIFKVPFIIVLASIFARGKDDKKKISYWGNFKAAFFYTIIFAIVITVCLKDMGTAIHYIMIACFMIFLSDIPNKVVFPAFFGVIAFIPVILYSVLHNSSGYKQHRIKVFLDGILHSNYDREEAYQIYQSLLAFGTGGVLGKGFGNGVQKYNYIPEVETDFAIATYAEETGFIGMIILFFLFFSLFVLIMSVANNAKNYFSKYLVGGIAGYFITQVIINIGVAIGLIPVFGIPLPFISSGGSSLLAISIAMGLVIYVNNTQTSK
ncbi:FtsW/RodA/SpoVE family cell cycle protein [Fusobacterium simiae]|uniref:FtsW/RodA/SpoVE family cell cycle protein n=1 Tax=Fusobacterium simiae TaxID=855 RepID=UPI0020C58B9E|nr:FtsW/RodA/SpoVE family cell cycle protein [Fusobacterium simiae]MDC7954999.1 FtsW/RodA/SpoVE family cell cycle protein [Fusobacterium simiae]